MLKLADLENAVTDDTAVVSLMWANNETGVLFPVKEIAAAEADVPRACVVEVELAEGVPQFLKHQELNYSMSERESRLTLSHRSQVTARRCTLVRE